MAYTPFTTKPLAEEDPVHTAWAHYNYSLPPEWTAAKLEEAVMDDTLPIADQRAVLLAIKELNLKQLFWVNQEVLMNHRKCKHTLLGITSGYCSDDIESFVGGVTLDNMSFLHQLRVGVIHRTVGHAGWLPSPRSAQRICAWLMLKNYVGPRLFLAVGTRIIWNSLCTCSKIEDHSEYMCRGCE